MTLSATNSAGRMVGGQPWAARRRAVAGPMAQIQGLEAEARTEVGTGSAIPCSAAAAKKASTPF